MISLSLFPFRRGLTLAAILVAGLLAALPAWPLPRQSSAKQESGSPAQASAPANNGPEMATRDTSTAFKVRVNLVLVRVVVRDDKGNIVNNLHKEDFLLFDNRKPQTVSTFSVETPASHVVPVTTISDRESTATEAVNPVTVALPQRFVSLLFDDLHISMEDSVTVRDAASRIFGALGPSDRVSIATTSGQFSQDFTNDKEILHRALLNIIPRNLGAPNSRNCPDIPYYMADLIENKSDTQALAVATEDALQCAFNGDPQYTNAARMLAQSTALTVLSQGDTQTEYAYRHLEDVLRKLSSMPGQRTVVFISPGFILSTLFTEASDIIDRAARSNIVIDTLDARGLYTPDVQGDVANPPRDSFRTTGIKLNYRVAAQSAQEDILRDFAYGTGGTFYHNRNDLDVALREAIAAPAVSYLLGFSPQNMKYNGAYHTIKVSLARKNNFNIQARRGYYAPRTFKDPAETAKEEIQEAVFSQEELSDLPINLQTQFFKKDETDARLSVLAHVDLKTVHFRKIDGRNNNALTLATAIFDQNGNFVTGGEKVVEMKLFDTTLERLNRSGITVKSSFDVKPGTYLVRLVVRDAEGEQMAARNGAVVIPY
jgi:VWFA-related protein